MKWKWDTIYFSSTKYLEIIFMLLIKVITVYIGFFKVDFWSFSLKRVFLKLCLSLEISLDQFH